MKETRGRPSLGRELVDRGLIDSATLEDARTQAATRDETLVEALLSRRAISQDQLVTLFHTQLGFPVVDESYFAKIEPATVALVPRELIVRHRVLPLYRAEDKLFVAAVDPLAQAALSEVSVACRHQVIVCVAKTFAILRAIGERLGVPALAAKKPKLKLEPMLDAADDEISISVVIPTPKPFMPPPSLPESLPPIPSPPSLFGVAPAGKLTAPKTRVVEVQSTAPNLFDAGIAPVTSPSDVRGPVSSSEYERFRAELMSATDRDGVGRILSLFSARFFHRVVLMAHKQGMLLGWQTVGTDLAASRLKGLIVPLHLPSTFQLAVAAKTYQVGRLDANMINSAFLAALGGSPAGHAVVIPILIDEKVAAVLYADTGGEAAPTTDLSWLYRLCEDAGQALASLIRRLRG